MQLVERIRQAALESVTRLYGKALSPTQFLINETKPEFEGDYTLVTFALSKSLGKSPDQLAHEIGEDLQQQQQEWIRAYEVIKGFLNLRLQDHCYTTFLDMACQQSSFGQSASNGQRVMVEYSSPNTNKPLHFGHLRNIFLGYAISNMYKAAGYEVIQANLINDRGIHICKSMVAWQHFADGATPASTEMKGDHFVGDYYVRYNEEYKKQVSRLLEEGYPSEEAEKKAPILLEAQECLRKWEAGDAATLELWRRMNAWVYEGFEQSYQRMGLHFDKVYYESETYLLGKTIVEQGLEKGVLFRKEDGSVWIDLTADGLDQKLLLRADGTSVYMTQDIGTAHLKYADYQMQGSVYVIGDEQNYHMQVLKLIMQKLGEPGADGIHHLSYGMVELPSGKMKSREGTVVDADDMFDTMYQMARQNTEALGKVEGFTPDALDTLYDTLGMGALKYYLLRVDPKKKMIFNPEESIDFHGVTGPFIQYTHARLCSILRKAGDAPADTPEKSDIQLSTGERQLLRLLEQYPLIIQQAAEEYNPSLLGNYLYQVARTLNAFLVDHAVLKAEDLITRELRLRICSLSRQLLAHGLALLGIRAPERM